MAKFGLTKLNDTILNILKNADKLKFFTQKSLNSDKPMSDLLNVDSLSSQEISSFKMLQEEKNA